MMRRCLGCRKRIARGSRCASCRREQKAPYHDPEYERNRELVLLRANYTCQLGLPGCTVVATTADHKVPLSHGGTNALDNLLAACLHCNSAKRDR